MNFIHNLSSFYSFNCISLCKNFHKLSIGQYLKVIGIAKKCNPYYKQRLLSQGIVPGAILQVKNIAPLGDPVELLLSSGGSFMARKQEINIINFYKL